MPSLPSLPGGAASKSSTAAGGLAVAIIWLLGLWGVVVPADVAVTLAVGLIGAAGWVAHRFGPQPEPPKAAAVLNTEAMFRRLSGATYDNGGPLQSGSAIVLNDTGKPERIFPQPEPPKAG